MDHDKVWYLAGMMRPLPDHNFPLFERVSKMLRLDGYTIISPHEMGEAWWSRGRLMSEDLATLIDRTDGVICLPGWQNSSGASCEVAVAFACEKPVYDIHLLEGNSYVLSESDAVGAYVPREKQYAEKIPLVGLCGYAQAGKDTVASYLVENHGWTRVAFADALRDVLYALNPRLPQLACDYGMDSKGIYRIQGIVDNYGWDWAKTNIKEIRELLQRLGTEAGRSIINENIWVRLGEEKLEGAGGPVVITDCRFPNEVALVRRRGGKLIWIDRPGNGPANEHASEHSVNPDDCDWRIYNRGTIADLHNHVQGLLLNGQFGQVSKDMNDWVDESTKFRVTLG